MTKKIDLVQTFRGGDLPSGWGLATISDLVGKDGVFKDGDWVESKDQDPNGDVRLIQLADIGDGGFRDRSSRFLTYEKAIKLRCTFLNKGDVLVARMPDPLGRACIFPGDKRKAVTVVDVCVVRPEDKDISNRWLMYFINAPEFRVAVASLQSGSTRRRISRKNLARLSFPVPPPNEQKRIVAEIEKQFSRLDEAVKNLKRVKVNLKRYKASVLKAAVEGKLTEEWRKANPDVEPADKLLERILAERLKKWEEAKLAKMKAKGKEPKDDKWKKKYKEPAVPEESMLSILPDGWIWASAEQLAEIQLGKMLDKQKHRKGNKLAYLRNINIRWGAINADDILEMFFKDTELDRYNLKTGDVLVCEGGEPGRAAVWDGRYPDMKYQKALHRVRFFGDYVEQLLVFYLEFLSQTGRLTQWFTGSTIKHFTKESFSGLPVPVPPKDEQVEIVSVTEEHLSNILVLERDVDANLIRAERLRQSILKKAFSGKLVSQGHNVEPVANPLKRSA